MPAWNRTTGMTATARKPSISERYFMTNLAKLLRIARYGEKAGCARHPEGADMLVSSDRAPTLSLPHLKPERRREWRLASVLRPGALPCHRPVTSRNVTARSLHQMSPFALFTVCHRS